jgi:hypothetical protein
MRWWKSKRAIQIRMLLGLVLLGGIGWMYFTHRLEQLFALLGAAVVLTIMSTDICRLCGLPWMIQPLGLLRGSCRRCEQELP